MSTIFKPWEGSGPTYGETTLTVLPASAVYATTAPPSATPFSMRRKSILSGVVHRRIRGVGFVFHCGSVDRLTNIKGLDVLLALKYIADRQRRSAAAAVNSSGGGGSGVGSSSSSSGGAAGAAAEAAAVAAAAEAQAEGGIEAAALDTLLSGFRDFADKVYKPIIPIPLTERCFPWTKRASAALRASAGWMAARTFTPACRSSPLAVTSGAW
jgi:hypothetical protein